MNSHVDQSSLDSARKCDEVVARHDMKNEQNLSCVFQLDISFFLLVIFGENKYGSLMRLQDAGRRVNKPRPTMCFCVAFFLAWLSLQISLKTSAAAYACYDKKAKTLRMAR